MILWIHNYKLTARYDAWRRYEKAFTTQLITTLKKKHFENIVGKGEHVDIQQLFIFPQCFLPFQKQI